MNHQQLLCIMDILNIVIYLEMEAKYLIILINLSNFKSNRFSVKKVKYLPNFGGRYFNEIIANNCIEEFTKNNNIDK